MVQAPFPGTRAAVRVKTSLPCSEKSLANGTNTICAEDTPLIALFALVAACLCGRNISAADLARFLLKCQQDALLPLLTLTLGAALQRYICGAASRSMGLARDSVVLEDAYGYTRHVSLDICADYGMMRRFLESHYMEGHRAEGQALLAAGQSCLMIGSRRGRIIGRSRWPNVKFRPGLRVVNLLYVHFREWRCPICREATTLSRGRICRQW